MAGTPAKTLATAGGLARERGSLATADKPGTSGTINNSKDLINSRGASNRRNVSNSRHISKIKDKHQQ
jgi:hypothetical protein